MCANHVEGAPRLVTLAHRKGDNGRRIAREEVAATWSQPPLPPSALAKLLEPGSEQAAAGLSHRMKLRGKVGQAWREAGSWSRRPERVDHEMVHCALPHLLACVSLALMKSNIFCAIARSAEVACSPIAPADAEIVRLLMLQGDDTR